MSNNTKNFAAIKESDRTMFVPAWNWRSTSELGPGEAKTRNVAGHCMIFARTDEVLWEKYPKKADVMVRKSGPTVGKKLAVA